MSAVPAESRGGLRTEDLGKHFSRTSGEQRGGRLALPSFRRRRKDPVRAVDGVEAAAGTVLGLLGRNGAGKTTFVKLLATLIEPSCGNAWISGFSIPTEGASSSSNSTRQGVGTC